MKKLKRKDVHRGGADAYMARIVPNNSFAFPPSMEVSVGGTIPGKELVESSQEQRPRAMHGAIAETLSFFGFYKFLAGANKFAPTLMTSPTINSFSQRFCAMCMDAIMSQVYGYARVTSAVKL